MDEFDRLLAAYDRVLRDASGLEQYAHRAGGNASASAERWAKVEAAKQALRAHVATLAAPDGGDR